MHASVQSESFKVHADGSTSVNMLVASSVRDAVVTLTPAAFGGGGDSGGGTMSATLGPFSSQLLDAGAATGILRTAGFPSSSDPQALRTAADGGLYADGRKIYVSLQVLDTATFSTRTTDTHVRVTVAPADGSTAVPPSSSSALSYEYRGVCSSVMNGICHLAIQPPASFFNSLVDGELLSVQYGLLQSESSGGSIAAIVPGTAAVLGYLPWWAEPEIAVDAVNCLYTTLPSRGVYDNEQFTIEVRSLFTASIKTAEVRVLAGNGLEFVSASLAKVNGKDVWFGTMDRETKQLSASFARKESTPLDGSARTPTHELLFTVKVKVKGAAAGTVGNTVLLEGIRFKDGNEALLAQSAAGMVITRSSVVTDMPASVYVQENAIAGVVAYAQGPTELFNTAILSGITQTTSIKVVGILTKGNEVDITKSCTCTSSNTDVLKVGSNGKC